MSILHSFLEGPRLWIDNQRTLLRQFTVVAGVIVVSALVGTLASLSLAAVVVMLPLSVAFLLVVLQHPQLGLLALIVVGLLAPRGPSDNYNATVLLLVLLTGLWFVHMVGRRRLFGYFRDVPVQPLLWLIGAALLGFMVGQLAWFPLEQAPLQAQLGGIAVFALSAGAFLMVAYYVNDIRWLKWMVWLLIIIGGLYVFGRIMPRPFRYVITLFPWGSTSTLYWLWLIAHVFSQLLLNRNLGPLSRLGLLALLSASLYAAGVQTFDWRSGWIPPLVAMGAIVVFRWPRIGVLLVVAGAVASPFVLSELISGDAYSYSTRVQAWAILLEMVKANPITGYGPSNYYWYTPLFRINDYEVSFSSHNQYVDLVAQVGIIGLLAYLWFFVKVGAIGWKAKEIAPEGFAQAYVYACLGGLVAMLVSGMLGDWVLPFVYNVGLVGMRSSILGWLYLGGLVALARMMASPSASPVPARADRAGLKTESYGASGAYRPQMIGRQPIADRS